MILRPCRTLLALLGVVLTAGAAPCTALPLAEEADLSLLQRNCRRLLEGLPARDCPLSAETKKKLLPLLQPGIKDPKAAALEIQELLDPSCLLAVTINPESRVKAMRGPAAAELRVDREVTSLIKVLNEAGVTRGLLITGPQLCPPGRSDSTRWLEARLQADGPLSKQLSGQKVEYLLLRLIGRQAGKREATLKFDVGQGTQDLGFRAELPILFTVRPAVQQPAKP
jgi:hypothetical protein